MAQNQSLEEAAEPAAQLQYDEEEEEEGLTTAFYTSGGGLVDRVRSVTFQLLNMMTENKKVTSRTKLTEVVLMFVDWLELTAILLSPVYGWHGGSVSWMQDFSVAGVVLPGKTPAVFNVGFIASVAITWLSFVDTGYVCWSIYKNSYRRIWPLKLLRVLVTGLVTAGFIPVMTVLSMPFDCREMQTYFGDTNCNRLPTVLYMVISILTLSIFVPFALMMRLVYFDDNPLSGLPTAKPLGRIDFYDTIMRSVLVIGTVLMRDRPSLLGAITLALMIALYLFTNMTLPYYNMKINQLRSSFYAVLVWLALGSLIAANTTLTGRGLAAFSITWVILSVLPLGAGILTPFLRYRFLGRLSWQVGNQVLYDREMKQLGIGEGGHPGTQSPNDLFESRRKSLGPQNFQKSAGLLEDLFAPPSVSRIHGSLNDQSDNINDTIPLSEEVTDENTTQQQQHGKTPLAELIKKYFLFEYDVEIMVRYLLSTPSRENFTQATVILNAALKAFPESAYIRVIFSSIILAYNSKSTRTVSLLQEAQRMSPPFYSKFLLFTKIHSWNQIRQNETVGTGKDMVSVIQFKKHYNRASEQHHEAIKLISKFWSTLYSGTIEEGSLASIVKRISEARESAEASYLSLLEKFPSNKTVCRSYGLFCLYVKNQEKVAEVHLRKANATGTKKRGALNAGEESSHGDGSSQGGSSKGGSSMGGSTLAEVRSKAQQRRMEIRHDELFAMKKMKIGFGLSVVILIALTLAMFIGSTQLMDRFFETLPAIGKAGTRRTGVEDIWFYGRSMHLAAVNNDMQLLEDSRKGLLDAASRLKDNHHELYFNGVRNNDIDSLWKELKIRVNFYSPAESDKTRTELFNLWDVGNLYISTATMFANLATEELRRAETIRFWRFLADNSFRVVLEHFEEAVQEYDHFNQKTADDSNILQGAILSVKALVTVALALFVFRPAIHAVLQAKRALHAIVERIPRHVVKFFHKRFRIISRIYSGIETADEEMKEKLEERLQEPKLRGLEGVLRKKKFRQKRGTSIAAKFPPATAEMQTVNYSKSFPTSANDKSVPQEEDKGSHSSSSESEGDAYEDNQFDPSIDTPNTEEKEETLQQEAVADDAFQDSCLNEVVGDTDYETDDAESKADSEASEIVGDDGIIRTRQNNGGLMPKLTKQNLERLEGRNDDGYGFEGIRSSPPLSQTGTVPSDAIPRASMEVAISSRPSREESAMLNRRSDGGTGTSTNQLSTPGTVFEQLDSTEETSPGLGFPLPKRSSDKQTFTRKGTSRGHPFPLRIKSQTEQVTPSKSFVTTSPVDQGIGEPTSEIALTANPWSSNNDLTESRESDEFGTQETTSPFKSRLGTGSHLTPINEKLVLKAKLPEQENQKPNAQSHFGSGSSFKTNAVSSNVNLCRVLFHAGEDSDQKQIRRLVLRLFICTLLLNALYVVNFYLSYVVMREGSHTGSELNNAERRIFLSSELVNFARELMIGDNELLPSINATRERIIERNRFLVRVHNGLRFGDEGLNLPGADRRGGALDEILYGTTPSAFNVTLDPRGKTLFSQGIEVALRNMLQASMLLVGTYGDEHASRPGRNLTKLREDERLQFLIDLDRNHLRPGLETAGDEFIEVGFDHLQQLRLYEILMLLSDFFLYFLLWAFIYRTMERELRDEGNRSEDVLLLIPAEVVEQTKSLHGFFKMNSNSWLN